MRKLAMNFDDVLTGGSLARNEDTRAFIKHPKLLKSMVVFSSRVVELTAKGLSSATFGSLDLGLYPTLEEALNAARMMLYGQSKAN
jgi:hypothetical protein